MPVKKSSLITFVLGLLAALLFTTSGCGDNRVVPGSMTNPGDSAKEITRFTIDGVDGTISGFNIALTLPFGTSLTSLTPTIEITGASVDPDSGVARDFSGPVQYTVTAIDGTTQGYAVVVTTAPSNAKDITRFTINGVDGAITGTSIALTLPFGTNLTTLAPTITITGAFVNPGSGVAKDFTSPVNYTVTAADGTTKTYTATVNLAPSNAKDITQFSILGVNGVINGTNISLTLPFGTSLTSLTPTITITGTSVSPASGAAQNFTGPVLYTVTAADGSTKVYTVTVGVALNNAKDITQFSINGVDGAINGTNISLTLPFGTNVTSLTPTIAITGVSVTPPSGVAQNFSSTVLYTVTAADGSTKTYTVSVSIAPNNAKDITQFTINGVIATISGTSISLTLPAGTNLTNLTPTVTITGVSVSPANGVAQNFTGPVSYTVTAADGSTKTYTVTVSIAPSSAKDITQFSINGVSGNINGTNISLTLPAGTNLTSLTPTISITGVSVTPASGVAQNFSGPVLYTVTAADGSTKTYTVSISLAVSSAKDITQFSILGFNGAINGTSISLTLPAGTNLTNLTPTIAITGVSVSPASGVARNFTGPVLYTVTAADGSTKTYIVMVGVAQDGAKDITQFTINGVDGNISGTNISLTLPFGTNLTNLTPTITITGTSVSPASGVAQNFTGPVQYTVTAADATTKTYTVTVGVALNSAKDITQFTINGVNGNISGTNISLTLPFGTSLASLTPTIAITGMSVSPASGMAQNFTGPVQYTVMAADGSTKVYTVTVSVALNDAKDITQFTILGVDGNISGTNISLTLPFGTSLASLTPTIAITGVSVSPASGVAQNFAAPVAYTVTAADGSTKIYTVTVNVALNSAKDITQFTILGVDGAINGTNISLTLPFGTSLASLTPTITITGDSVSPVSGAAQNFTGPVLYTVTASDGSTKIYTVSVSVALNSAKDITQFTINGVDGTISGTSISLTLPFGTNRASLTPSITITGDSVSPASGATQDFTAPVQYTVTAADGSTKDYMVTVNIALNNAKDITQFTILGVDGTISGTNISLTLPFGTNVTSLTPGITITGTSVSPASGVTQDFSAPVMYTVTAADASTKTYTVTVSVALNDAKDITQFTILGVDGTISGTNISLTLPFGTNVASLTPTIAITGNSVSPASGVAQNFTGPVQYTVTAADGSTKVYTVTVSVALNNAKDITQFTILGLDATISGTNISLIVPMGTDLTSLTPTIVITGVNVTPGSGVTLSFTSPIDYTVTAADGSTKTYTATVTAAVSSEKDIIGFQILGVDGIVNGTNITLTVPFGTNVTSLVPTVVHTGVSVSPASGVAQNFTGPVVYTVTAQDGSTKSYTVTVSIASGADKDIIRFTVGGLDAAIATTSPTTGVIELNVPSGTNLAALTPTVTITGVSVSPASGVTQNFTGPVLYTVTAADGSTKVYTVTIGTVNGNGTKLITSFSILGVFGSITNGANSSTITLTLPAGTDLSAQTPTIVINASSLTPPSRLPRNFTNPVTYTVTAANGSTRVYTVIITLAP